MARPLRIEYPGAFYHVINGGNAGENIYRDDGDRRKFIEYLSLAKERFNLGVHSYCLMDNHYHVLIETPEGNLSRAIQWLNVSYAVYFNGRRKRRGHLFQGRFKAILVDADEYLKVLSRYIHLNPVRAGVVDSPGEYKWSSYRAFTGETGRPDWLETGWLLGCLDSRNARAVKLYREFCESVDPVTIEDPKKDLIEGCILGSEGFASWVRGEILSGYRDKKEIPELKRLKQKPAPSDIVAEVAREYNLKPEEIVQRGKKRNIAREVAIYLALSYAGLSGKNTGEYFGGISGSRVTVTCQKIRGVMAQDKPFRRRVEKIVSLIVNK